jgi:cysteine-rich repeat protein
MTRLTASLAVALTAALPGCLLLIGLAPPCGDFLLDAGEECDDGNLDPGDGCDAGCLVEALPELEPNNNRPDADARAVDDPRLEVSGDARLRGAIGFDGDRDFFRLNLAAAATIRFETFDGTGVDCAGGIAPFLRLFDPDNQLAQAQGSGINGCAAIVFNVPAGVTYIQVEDAGNNDQIAEYVLEVDLQEPAAEVEPNDSPATATPLAGSDVAIFGGHQVNADIDFFVIQVPDGLSLRAEQIEGGAEACEQNGLDTFIQLLDEGGQVLAENASGGRGDCSRIDGTGATPKGLFVGAQDLPAGRYFLRVSTTDLAGPNGQFDYRLAVTFR